MELIDQYAETYKQLGHWSDSQEVEEFRAMLEQQLLAVILPNQPIFLGGIPV